MESFMNNIVSLYHNDKLDVFDDDLYHKFKQCSHHEIKRFFMHVYEHIKAYYPMCEDTPIHTLHVKYWLMAINDELIDARDFPIISMYYAIDRQ